MTAGPPGVHPTFCCLPGRRRHRSRPWLGHPAIWWLSGIAVLLLVLLGGGCAKDEAEIDASVYEAERALDRRDLVGAAGHLREALLADPADAYARWLFGQVHQQLGDWQSAAQQLDFAQALGMSRDTIATDLALALLMMGHGRTLVDQRVPRGLTREGLAPFHAVMSMAALVADDPQLALSLARKTQRDRVGAELGSLANAQIALYQGHLFQARSLLRELVERWPNNDWGWAMLGDTEQALGDKGAATVAYRHAIQVNPWRPRWRYNLALRLIDDGQLARAEAQVERLEHLLPRSAVTLYARGRLLSAQGDTTAALSYYQLTLEQKPVHVGALYHAAVALARIGSEHTATAYLRTAVVGLPEAYLPRLALADIEFGAGSPRRVLELLSPTIDSGQIDRDGLGLMAGAMLDLDRPDVAVALLRLGSQGQRADFRSELQLGLALLADGQVAAAAAAIDAANVQRPQLLAGDLLLLRAYRRHAELAAARERVERLVQRLPDRPEPFLQAGWVDLAAGRTPAARGAFEAAARLEPQSSGAARGLAAAALQQGDTAGAVDILEQQLTRRPDDLGTRAALVILLEAQGLARPVLRQLSTALELAPERLDFRTALAYLELREGRAQDAVDLLHKHAPDFVDNVSALAVYATALTAAGEPEQARPVAERGAMLQPTSARVAYLNACVNLAIDRPRRAVAALDRALRLDPTLDRARKDVVDLHLRDGRLASAAANLTVLAQRRPEDAEVLELAGRLALAQGDLVGARDRLTRALAQGRGRRALLTLVRVERRLGEAERGQARLEVWLAGQGEDMEARLLRAELLFQLGRQDLARAEWERVLVSVPEHPTALNNLAWMLRDTEPELAMGYAARAYAAAPRSAAIADTYARLLELDGKPVMAERILGRALGANPSHRGLVLRRAGLLARLGRERDAIGTLQALLQEAADDAWPRQPVLALLATLQAQTQPQVGAD